VGRAVAESWQGITVTKVSSQTAVPPALTSAGWLLFPGVAFFAWRAFADLLRHTDTGYSFVHNYVLFFLWAAGSWWLAHLWLAVISVIWLARHRRRGGTDRQLQIEVVALLSLFAWGYLSFALM
jgi:hypothetical protein